MAKELLSRDEKKANVHKPKNQEVAKHHTGKSEPKAPLTGLQQQIGNRAVQRLLAQRSGEGPSELDEETASRINRERGGGQPLDTAFQKQTSEAMGHDLSGVQVHTSPEAHDLSRQLGAKAFTTGQDVFFREGAYDPHSSGGQELIAHELTHVAQQSSGAVGGASKMTVNAPGDAFEQEADAIAKTVASPGAQVQRQVEEEEEPLQMPAEEEEEPLQMQAEEEEEETLQTQEMEEEEELTE